MVGKGVSSVLFSIIFIISIILMTPAYASNTVNFDQSQIVYDPTHESIISVLDPGGHLGAGPVFVNIKSYDSLGSCLNCPNGYDLELTDDDGDGTWFNMVTFLDGTAGPLEIDVDNGGTVLASFATPRFLDTTENNNHGIFVDSTDVPAKIANGQRFDGVDDVISVSFDPSHDSIFGNGGTVTAWINPSSVGEGNQGRVFEKTVTSIKLQGVSGDTSGIRLIQNFDQTNGVWKTTNKDITFNQWNHIAITYDASSSLNDPTFYINGEEFTIGSGLTEVTPPAGNAVLEDPNLSIGNTNALTKTFDGIIDEFRIHDGILSTDWIEIEYNNQNAPASFYSIGQEETSSADWYDDNWQFRKAITIDQAQVPSDQTDFPLLINILSDSDLTKAQADGDDFLFTDAVNPGVKLSSEIESWDYNSGDLVAWVNVPTLSSGFTTTIFMYYGHTSIANQENKADTWQSNYKAVYHLSPDLAMATIVNGHGDQEYGSKLAWSNNWADCFDDGRLGDWGGDDDLDGVCDDWEDDSSKLEIGYPRAGGDNYITTCSESEGFLDKRFGIFTECSGSDMRDIYVEIDYMIGHRPNYEALKEVVQAFYDAPDAPDTINPPNRLPEGIRLHIQIDDSDTNEIFHHKTNSELPPLYQDCTMTYGTFDVPIRGFDPLKAKFSGTPDERDEHPGVVDWWDKKGWKQKKQVFHYSMFAHQQCDGTDSGKGEKLGNDFVVTLGPHDDFIVGSPDQQAGTFMHELGHNLGLDHGGALNDLVTCKPNHLSVMSYSRQFSDLVSDRSLDFSRQLMGTQDDPTMLGEDHGPDFLIEARTGGMVDGAITIYDEDNADPNERLVWGVPPNWYPPLNLPSTNEDSINWNDDANVDQTNDYSQDLNVIMSDLSGTPLNVCGDQSPPGTMETLQGHDDWENIVLNSKGDGDWGDGRSAGAGTHQVVWNAQKEDKERMMPAPFCVTAETINSVIPAGATEEQRKNHFSNYRTCSSGPEVTDKEVIACSYYLSIARSIEADFGSFLLAPEKFDKFDFSSEILSFCKTKFFEDKFPTIDSFGNLFVDKEKFFKEHFPEIESELNIKYSSIKDVIELKKLGVSTFLFYLINEPLISPFESIVEPSDSDAEKVQQIINTFDTIDGSKHLSSENVKAMKFSRINSLEHYVENKIPDEKFIGDGKSKILGELNIIRADLSKGSIELAVEGLMKIDYDDYVNPGKELNDLQAGTLDIVKSYSTSIPEFGAIATLILVAAITSIIILTTKSRNIFIPKNYQ